VHLLDQARARREQGQGTLRVLTTGEPEKVGPVVARLWGAALTPEAVRI
jgi:hypothetical protein